MTPAREERIGAADGGTFSAYCALPAGTPAPAIVLLQEVFGVNDNMRELAHRLAGRGYLTLVPDMFWRLRPGFESKDESGLAEGMALAQRLDLAAAAGDLAQTLGHARSLPECSGKVAGVGFCLGGTLAYLLAVHADPDAVVSYYGSGVHTMLDDLDRIGCPVLFHYGDEDPFIPREAVAAVEADIAGRPGMELYHYAAGHAFSNFDAPSFHQPEAAELAWGRTLEFLDRHLRA
ncbi:dienelactone hydrolase family protein [Prauserella oleivorans]|uniref:Dienelactone hydrolase family protein n=1 Tax=Prauserella oleivorans TaxID=1478153 RepID=A0ABW5WFR3_9PSEU